MPRACRAVIRPRERSPVAIKKRHRHSVRVPRCHLTMRGKIFAGASERDVHSSVVTSTALTVPHPEIVVV